MGFYVAPFLQTAHSASQSIWCRVRWIFVFTVYHTHIRIGQYFSSLLLVLVLGEYLLSRLIIDNHTGIW